jgi:integrase
MAPNPKPRTHSTPPSRNIPPAAQHTAPAAHKTAHHGHERTIFFGPKAQDVLTPFLSPDRERYLFRPHNTRNTYLQAIARACDLDVPHWHPHQLRHTAGTRYRRKVDFEAAKIVLA